MPNFRTSYGVDHLLGNTNIPRNISPMLFGQVRRTDPDGSSLVPYFPSLSGKTLNISYSVEISGTVTPATTSVTFSANDLQNAEAQINALDALNLHASDTDGFLVITNANSGKTHYLTITASTAAAVLGFTVDPYPGSTSVAGEVSSSPPNRSQSNPEGTALIAKDEALSDSVLNRGLAGVLDVLYRLIREQDREIIGFTELRLATSNYLNVGGTLAIIVPFSSSLRIPTTAALLTNPLTGSVTGHDFSPFFHILDVGSNDMVLSTNLVPRIVQVFWGNQVSTTATSNTPFSTFLPLPTPTALSVYGDVVNVPKVLKLTGLFINNITGNVVSFAGSPALLDNYVVPGDYAIIRTSTINTPFSHNGEFIVDDVLDQSTLVLRPKSKFDYSTGLAATSPPGLNKGTSGLGLLDIAVGPYLAGPGLIFLTNVPYANRGELTGTRFRIATGSRLKDIANDGLAMIPAAGIANLVNTLIKNTATDGATLIGAQTRGDLVQGTVRSQLNNLDDFIATTNAALAAEIVALATATGTDGASLIGAKANNGLLIGTVRSQLDQIQSYLNSTVKQSFNFSCMYLFSVTGNVFNINTPFALGMSSADSGVYLGNSAIVSGIIVRFSGTYILTLQTNIAPPLSAGTAHISIQIFKNVTTNIVATVTALTAISSSYSATFDHSTITVVAGDILGILYGQFDSSITIPTSFFPAITAQLNIA